MTSKKAQQDFDDDGDYDAEDDAGEDENLDEETEEGTRPSVMAADNDNKATPSQVQFALDLSKEKGKDHSKSDLQGKSKAEISKMIEDMQKEETKASEKQVSYALDLLKANGRSSPNKSGLEKMSEVAISKLIDDLKAKDKTATFDEVRDVLVRTAYFTTDQETKRKLLRMLQADPG
jgi:Mg/Co/Ni transporter MgtE